MQPLLHGALSAPFATTQLARNKCPQMDEVATMTIILKNEKDASAGRYDGNLFLQERGPS